MSDCAPAEPGEYALTIVRCPACWQLIGWTADTPDEQVEAFVVLHEYVRHGIR